MRFIGNVIEKLQRHPKRVVFPEGTEPRILQAARQFYALRLGAPIVLGNQAKVREVAEGLNTSIEGIRIIDPVESEDLDNFAKRFHSLRRDKGIRAAEAREAVLQPNYFGTMMVAMHQADGLISGASHFTGSVLRPLFQIIKAAPDIATVSSCMIMEVEDTRVGENGVLFMADCGVVPDPNVDQLADIAVTTARLARHTLGIRPRVALLSFRPRAARRIRPSARCRPPPRWPNARRNSCFWKPTSTVNCRWTPHSCRKSPNANCTTARLPDARTC